MRPHARSARSIQVGPRPLGRYGTGGIVKPAPALQQGGQQVIVFRHELGDVLRDVRRRQGRTLRQVSQEARVSLGYLSEVERGQKEASSELLSSICQALGIPLSFLLREVSERIALAEGVAVPDTVPDDLARSCAATR
ncbi:helix-turn-helix domain-containing protein [Dermabacteraceae bacterium TAE3-ERU27]|nr:helix-turn-helix domain-containing protein [Dermabacteraceae bacterium TAE3-ERU27]